MRPTRAEINLGHLRHNYHLVRKALADIPADRKGPAGVWPVLKADAYGHGAPAVARTLERAGADGLCVALLEEGIDLRAAGITLPILVMGGYYGQLWRGLDEAVAHNLTPVLYDRAQVERLASLSEDRGGAPLAFHLKVDTGMARLGASFRDLDDLLRTIASRPSVEMRGLMSHLACADAAEPSATREQLQRFERVREQAKAAGLVPTHVHIANSAGALAFPEARLDFVRPGILLFGVSPFFGTSHHEVPRQDLVSELRPVMRIRTELVALRDLAAGEGVGYGHAYRTESARRIAVIPMGYADGLSRALSNRGQVVVRGKLAPIVGIVSMDLTTIDVTDIDGAALGDEVVVLGTQEGPLGTATVTAEDLAHLLGTIPWEVVNSVSRRVPRFYREP